MIRKYKIKDHRLNFRCNLMNLMIQRTFMMLIKSRRRNESSLQCSPTDFINKRRMKIMINPVISEKEDRTSQWLMMTAALVSKKLWLRFKGRKRSLNWKFLRLNNSKSKLIRLERESLLRNHELMILPLREEKLVRIAFHRLHMSKCRKDKIHCKQP